MSGGRNASTNVSEHKTSKACQPSGLHRDCVTSECCNCSWRGQGRPSAAGGLQSQLEVSANNARCAPAANDEFKAIACVHTMVAGLCLKLTSRPIIASMQASEPSEAQTKSFLGPQADFFPAWCLKTSDSFVQEMRSKSNHD